PLENAVFFARLVQRVITLLTTPTASGVLYEVDMRLRPSGSSGLLVSSLEAFARYQREEAWTWEHQALVRARPVAGDESLANGFEAIRREILCRPRDTASLRDEVRHMRERMWCEHARKKPGRFDLKRDPGGITDIEFMVQYAVLAHAASHPELVEWTDNIRLLEALAHAGVLETDRAERLAGIYREFRDHLHHRHLAGKGADVARERFAEASGFVRQIWRDLMGAPAFSGRDDCKNRGED
ncbi:MAG: bifunctional glutamine synthetase adenylyltransferase/deadenyltransferase, partial [Gammaproteobacteria bacterium]